MSQERVGPRRSPDPNTGGSWPEASEVMEIKLTTYIRVTHL